MIGHWRMFAGLLFNIPFLHNKSSGVTLEYNEELRQWGKPEINGIPTRHVPDAAVPSPTMCHYIGKLKDGKPIGFGTLTITPQTYSFITVYSGEWKEGRFHGKGRLKTEFSSHSWEYSGHFKDGQKHGYGHETWLGGEYKGQYENDKMCGEPTNW